MLLHRTAIARRLADDDMFAVSTWSLRQATVAHPEALAVASPGQAQLQIFNLALIPIVRIRPQINHMKLNKHTRRLLLSPSVRIARSKLFLFISVFSTLAVLQRPRSLVYIYTAGQRFNAPSLYELRLPNTTRLRTC
jgi:hypothetical protein